MNRDQRRLLVLHGEASAFQALLVSIELRVSSEARRRRKRMAFVSSVLRSAIGEPDDTVAIEKPARPRLEIGKWLLFAALAGVAMLEYRGYTFPAIGTWIRTVLHRCGL